ncbi:MAG: serine/threonine-protein kinase [Gemmataceae bacterium]
MSLGLLLAAGPPALAQVKAPPPPPTGGGVSWLLILGVGLVFVVVGGLFVLVLLQGKKSKGEATGTISTEDRLGNYRLLNLMMTGQTSQVWEVADMSSGLHFAIKLLLPEHAKNKETRSLLFHEAEVGKELAHPNIIRVVSVNKDEKHPHFVMDFFPGGNMKVRIQRKESDFIKQHAHNILKQAATALAFMNTKGWVHRDIKPDNILVNSSGEVRVIDLAIAQKIKGSVGKMFGGQKGKTQGTRSYMSPEQIRNESLDGRADIYSFGATAYELVTGRPPFCGATSQDLLNKHLAEKPISPCVHNPDVTAEFGDFVLKLLSKKKEDRPNNFHEVLIAMRNIRVFKADVAKEKGDEVGEGKHEGR